MREKTGLDGDGFDLVQKSFGGKNPLIKVSKLQTQTDQNKQKGILLLLQGIYLGIRNPRVHEITIDTSKSANAIILFLDHLISEISDAKSPYNIPDFIRRVTDPFFVRTKIYADILVSEVPKNKLFDTMIEVYRLTNAKIANNKALIIKSILSIIDESKLTDFLAVVSDDLKKDTEFTELTMPFRILTPVQWQRIEKSAKIRIENQILKSISEGECTARNELFEGLGALGTWGGGFLSFFDYQKSVQKIFMKKLEGDFSEVLYVFSYFLPDLPKIFKKGAVLNEALEELCAAIERQDDYIKDDLIEILKDNYWNFPNDWRTVLVEKYPIINEEDRLPF